MNGLLAEVVGGVQAGAQFKEEGAHGLLAGGRSQVQRRLLFLYRKAEIILNLCSVQCYIASYFTAAKGMFSSVLCLAFKCIWRCQIAFSLPESKKSFSGHTVRRYNNGPIALSYRRLKCNSIVMWLIDGGQ